MHVYFLYIAILIARWKDIAIILKILILYLQTAGNWARQVNISKNGIEVARYFPAYRSRVQWNGEMRKSVPSQEINPI